MESPKIYYLIDNIRPVFETPSYSNLEMDAKGLLYMLLPLEVVATKWAVNYINNNDIRDLEVILN